MIKQQRINIFLQHDGKTVSMRSITNRPANIKRTVSRWDKLYKLENKPHRIYYVEDEKEITVTK